MGPELGKKIKKQSKTVKNIGGKARNIRTSLFWLLCSSHSIIALGTGAFILLQWQW